MRLLLLASHAVAEYDDLRMFTDLGYDAFAPGGYEVPSRSGEGIRPPLPKAPHHPELVQRLQEAREQGGEPGRFIDWGKAKLHDDIIDWADAIIVHHFPREWIGGQWDRIKHKRVIWRTCGQSDPALEMDMRRYKGLQIVRYSPAERRYFEKIRVFAGEDALIRFGKYPQDFQKWVGDDLVVGNVTQDLQARGEATGYDFWRAATEGLPVKPAGQGSEMIGGVGKLSYPDMLSYLAHIRVYLYTGTVPASYTLGLIEAMMTGVPVIGIGKHAWAGPPELFEADDLLGGYDDPKEAAKFLRGALDMEGFAEEQGAYARYRAIELFSIRHIGRQWQDFLS